MRKESLQSEQNQQYINKIPNILRAGATATILTAGTLLPFDTKGVAAGEINNLEKPNITILNTQSQSEKISDFLKNDEARFALAASLGLSIAALTSAYLLGKKYDDKYEKALRLAGPTLAIAASSSLLINSYETIPPEIPGALIVGTSLMIAGHTLLNTFEYEANLKIRASAVATAGFMVTTGIATFAILSDKL